MLRKVSQYPCGDGPTVFSGGPVEEGVHDLDRLIGQSICLQDPYVALSGHCSVSSSD
jgi:hypothetical protein